MIVSEAEEQAKWVGLEDAIQLSQQAVAQPSPPPPPTVEQLPPPPPVANVSPPPHVFINLGLEAADEHDQKLPAIAGHGQRGLARTTQKY
jgi:hypothetical protein